MRGRQIGVTGMVVALTLAGTPGVSVAASGGSAAPDEVRTLGGQTVILHPLPFLHPDELATLRLVATNAQALALFVPRTGGHAAIAVAPDEGFLRDGQPVPSAEARGGLPTAAAARNAALAACDKTRKTGRACAVVLEVAPKG